MSTQQPTSRKSRREAARADRRTEPRRRQPQQRRSLPLGWITLAAVLIGGVLIVGVALAQGSPAPPTADLTEPLVHTDVSKADGRTLGDATAPVTVELWSDFQCPVCERFASTTEGTLIGDYVSTGKARLVYRDRAFLGNGTANDESVLAATGARCAADQGEFWEYHDWLFANQQGENRGAFTRDRLVAIAIAVGLDQAAFETCFDGPDTRAAVRSETAEGASAGINATPSIVVAGGQTFQGLPVYAELSAAIDAAVEAAGGVPSPVPSASTAPAG